MTKPREWWSHPWPTILFAELLLQCGLTNSFVRFVKQETPSPFNGPLIVGRLAAKNRPELFGVINIYERLAECLKRLKIVLWLCHDNSFRLPHYTKPSFQKLRFGSVFCGVARNCLVMSRMEIINFSLGEVL